MFMFFLISKQWFCLVVTFVCVPGKKQKLIAPKYKEINSMKITRFKNLMRALLATCFFATASASTVSAQISTTQTPGAGEAVTVTEQGATWIQVLQDNGIDIPAGADGVVISNGEGGNITAPLNAIVTQSDTSVINAGNIAGGTNAINFVNGAGSGSVTNLSTGVISSDSRAINIGGPVAIQNAGQIIGTGDQRNGTVYSDSSADNFSIDNSGSIDAGAGNQGAGFSAELSAAGNDFSINNSGTLAGRGDAGAGLATAGDGIRLERSRVDGALDGTTTGLFTGDITNSGTISSCLLYTSPSPRDRTRSRMPSSA